MEQFLERIMALFGGLDRVHGEYQINEELTEKGKNVGPAKTIGTGPTPELWRRHLLGELGLGIVPVTSDATVNWACIDIDAYKENVTATVHQLIRENELPFVVCRSKSGGAHVFAFFNEYIPASIARRKMTAMAASIGYDGSEIYPKQDEIKDDEFGNWLNMPYFNWQYTNRYGLSAAGQELDLGEFLDYAESMKIDLHTWKALKEPKVEVPFVDGPPCLQELAQMKVGEGGRNCALLQFGVYAKLKYGETEYEDKVVEYNQSYFAPPIPNREVNDTVLKSLRRRDYGYSCTQQPQASVCNRTVCMRRQYGVGGAVADAFEAQLMMQDMRKLIYYSPLGEPLDDDPMYELNVEGRVVRFTAKQIYDQNQFAQRCMIKLDKIPPRLPLGRWIELINRLLEEAETLEIPFETSPQAQTYELLKKYIAHNSHAKSTADLMSGLVMKKDNAYRFRLEPFHEFMRDRMKITYKMREISDHLEALGLKRIRTTIRDNTEHKPVTVWEVTESQIDLFDKPLVKREAPPEF